jgi:molybdate transport system substrate-binding protein
MALHRRIRGLLAAGFAWVLLAPGSTPATAQTASAPIVVFAAASLKESLDAAADAWAATGRRRPVVSYAGTPALARQIEQGAAADVFIAADSDWMDRLAARGLVQPASRVRLLGNSLVLVAPARPDAAAGAAPGKPPPVLVRGEAIAAELGTGRLALADVRAVPAGRYARAALESLGAWAALEPRLAQTENVRAALALVARGEAPLGIVYATDARVEPRVRVVGTFPASSHPPIEYPLALTASARAPEAAAFAAFLRSPAGAAVFERHGFSTGLP